MPLLNALDFAADRLLVGYRASLEPQNLTVHFTLKAPTGGATSTFPSLCSYMNTGMAGSDVFAPTAGGVEPPSPHLMRDGRIAPDEYKVVLKGVRGVAPIFIRQIVEIMRGVGRVVELSSLDIRGELPTDASDMSVTERGVRQWLEHPLAYPRRWPKPSFVVEEKDFEGRGVSARIAFAEAPDDVQRQELQTRILGWRNLANYYVSPEGKFVSHSLGPTLPKIVFKKTEAVASIEQFHNTRGPAMDILVNVLERAHHEVVPITRVVLTT